MNKKKHELEILLVRVSRWLPSHLTAKQVIWVAKEINKHLTALNKHETRAFEGDYDEGKGNALLDGRLRKLRKRLNVVIDGAGDLVRFSLDEATQKQVVWLGEKIEDA
jgi:hypothetical protein